MTVHAVANPQQFGVTPHALNERAPGFGLVIFDKKTRVIRLENDPRWADFSKAEDVSGVADHDTSDRQRVERRELGVTSSSEGFGYCAGGHSRLEATCPCVAIHFSDRPHTGVERRNVRCHGGDRESSAG